MTVNFINSETFEIDGKILLYLKEPLVLLKQIEQTLSDIGPEKFFSSPKEEVKRVRESMAIFYLILTFQKQTKDFIFCMQPKNDPPDFMLLKIGDQLSNFILDSFELVEIPTRCSSFTEMMEIIQKKIDKGYSESYNLLIFINNVNSKEWVSLLNNKLQNYHPFKAIWTLHLLELHGDQWPVVNKLRPYPIQHFETKLDQIKLPTGIPNLMEEKIHDGKRFLTFKPELQKELKNKVREMKFGNK